ncbi:hypothetical protein EYF80_056938 [Liparis tanakae]|uniref:Uncharacterized protein n=1 Tax=Liparis tanakae TaxID=230148 RepID=A0A4Z2EVQ7_9TELE|nr:hypothetical protein EYF80_056938 [Liparis tanakae]
MEEEGEGEGEGEKQRLRRQRFDSFCSRLFENVLVVAFCPPEHSMCSNLAVENKGTFATVFQDVTSVLSSLSHIDPSSYG